MRLPVAPILNPAGADERGQCGLHRGPLRFRSRGDVRRQRQDQRPFLPDCLQRSRCRKRVERHQRLDNS
jgi:hypothetical protein